MDDASIFVANEKEVLYDFVTILLQSYDTVSNNDFIFCDVLLLNLILIFLKLTQEEHLDRELLIDR